MDERNLLLTAVKAADDKRAENIVALNMKGISLVSDYFVICHGNSDKQVQAIASEIKDKCEEIGVPVKRLEGYQEAKWILVDLGDIVVHVFHRDERTYYNLERLWGDAPAENIQSEIGQ
ncbi:MULTISPECIES: ribosome silencing factor [Bacillaceae]|uniref:ribosome silencing factor n=1 Tax=Bacillaceae TaxID=186817 RepID=UPI001E3FB596|nr:MULTISPECIES: ribosome silencing factor [Bacillaceae]MCE4046975.1 ribosome silencing factor [Bacillus sp. Au-Bac7]MCM3030079.1 ribosome silencing factor [Niallia sp. MER 6]MDL0436528.1 ribosome silencing factor [Niallia sp. SS-2023]UPO86636.1 ribosome silencing factor [Niallia sp. Man26]